MTKTAQWYTAWFNTPYYHILYKDRGHNEAEMFMQNLTNFLELHEDSHILDLACGKGRHSIYLNKLGYEVTGLDLSEESIKHAKQFENSRLHFDVHDMSVPYFKKFDAVFNLFTSFGYFDKEEDNLNTICSIKQDLKENGIAVIDFFNVEKLRSTLIPKDEKTIHGLHFKMQRRFENGFIIKDIRFEDKGQQHHYQERVKALTLFDFKEMLAYAGCELITTFGDYKLNDYISESSDRLILIFKAK